MISIENKVMRMLGIQSPIFAFSHSVAVTVAVTNAGGFAVLGVARDAPEEIRKYIQEVRSQVGTKKFGVDLMFPKLADEDSTLEKVQANLPAGHKDFVEHLREKYQVPVATQTTFFTSTVRSKKLFEEQLNAVLESDVDAVATAVGIPREVMNAIKARGKIAMSLIGSPKHAMKALNAGVDILVAQGTEAGGHTGDISTMVLVPQIVEMARDVPVLAAGGIGHGSQIAAALALGAQGVWLGTAWLTTKEHQLAEGIVAKLLAANSDDTVISRSHSGKPCRLLKSGWTEEWSAPNAPTPLGMPLQQALTGNLLAGIEEHQVDALLYSPAGQSVAWSKKVEPVSEVMARLNREMSSALNRLSRQDI
ncbi:2-nitropropane dioxygenase [Comamonas thiooxydans]|uniref:NAD(P)H-dependent flavin oxidoreductase n=1 Tax=Comamonas thiooxydans TaxID=363952 RepID=UPI0007C53344|nr:nitronate monooxygenase [Comamonas thiooxydans]OAD85583.1 2-nitropropane dioxygenase [Comamonas thiooxydans]